MPYEMSFLRAAVRRDNPVVPLFFMSTIKREGDDLEAGNVGVLL